MKILSLLVSLFGLAAASSVVDVPDTELEARRAGDVMAFECDKGFDQICTNMCYGVYCAGIGSKLQYDKPDAPTKRNRRKAAGCIASGGNRCSTKKGHAANFQCDEYPFASSVPSSNSNTRLNRCVLATQNRMQGSLISAFYQSAYCKGNNGGKCNFSVGFFNAGGIMYCDQKNCANDGNEVIGPGGIANPGDSAEDGTDNDPDVGQKKKRRNGLGKRIPGVSLYRTSSGMELNVPGGAQIGQRALVVVPRNATLWDEQARFGNPNQMTELHGDEDEEDEDYEYMLANLEIREDTIVEEITPVA